MAWLPRKDGRQASLRLIEGAGFHERQPQLQACRSMGIIQLESAAKPRCRLTGTTDDPQQMAKIEHCPDVGGRILNRRTQRLLRLSVAFTGNQGKRQVHLRIGARAGIDRQPELSHRRAGLAAREVSESEQVSRDWIARPRFQKPLQFALGRTMPAGPEFGGGGF